MELKVKLKEQVTEGDAELIYQMQKCFIYSLLFY